MRGPEALDTRAFRARHLRRQPEDHGGKDASRRRRSADAKTRKLIAQNPGHGEEGSRGHRGQA
jgi:hypothetical protein